jgi:ankyrin repeat protein
MTSRKAPTEIEIFNDAAWQNDVEIIRDLAKKHPYLVDPAQPHLNTALRTACGACQADSARVLVEEFRADPNACDPLSGTNALHEALNASDMVTARMLVNHGADVNVRDGSTEGYTAGWTPLHYAIAHRDAGMIRFLAEHGANPNIPDALGQNALAFAYKVSRPEITAVVEKLIPPAGGPATKGPKGPGLA